MMKPYKVDQKKWNEFSSAVQLQHIATELSRATQASLHNDKEWREGAYERAIALVDATIDNPNQKNKEFFYQLRDALAALYVGKADPAISRFIYTEILERSSKHV